MRGLLSLMGACLIMQTACFAPRYSLSIIERMSCPQADKAATGAVEIYVISEEGTKHCPPCLQLFAPDKPMMSIEQSNAVFLDEEKDEIIVTPSDLMLFKDLRPAAGYRLSGTIWCYIGTGDRGNEVQVKIDRLLNVDAGKTTTVIIQLHCVENGMYI